MNGKFYIEYNPDFFDDLVQAVDWYNEQRTGLGDRFCKSVKKQTAKLSTNALDIILIKFLYGTFSMTF